MLIGRASSSGIRNFLLLLVLNFGTCCCFDEPFLLLFQTNDTLLEEDEDNDEDGSDSSTGTGTDVTCADFCDETIVDFRSLFVVPMFSSLSLLLSLQVNDNEEPKEVMDDSSCS